MIIWRSKRQFWIPRTHVENRDKFLSTFTDPNPPVWYSAIQLVIRTQRYNGPTVQLCLKSKRAPTARDIRVSGASAKRVAPRKHTDERFRPERPKYARY